MISKPVEPPVAERRGTGINLSELLGSVHSKRNGIPMPKTLHVPPGDDSVPANVLEHLRAVSPKADLERAAKIASSLRNPAYTLRNFHDDVVASFPELRYTALSRLPPSP